MKRVITFGTFDVFHVGHLDILERARSLGDQLIVGVSTDALTFSKKQRMPIYLQNERRKIVAALRCVDEVFFEESLEKKREYVVLHRANILVMGDDWKDKFDGLKNICEVIYLERTPSMSTTATIEKIRA